MENLLLKVASESDIADRIHQSFQEMFGQDSPSRIYFENDDDTAYITDTGNDDVRTEGMSYGMMIAVQLDKPEMFTSLWSWVKRYMTSPNTSENAGYFIWSCGLDGQPNDSGPAPDGEEYFAAALLLAEQRWGNRGYGDEARELLHNMVHKGEKAGTGHPMFDPDRTYIRFVPSLTITDPSYHLPHFYDLFAQYGNPEDADFFKKAAEKSRQFLVKTADAQTGLTPEYADYEGKPYDLDGHWTFFSDAYRTAANIGLDWLWSQTDSGQRAIAQHCQQFFEKYLGQDVKEVPVFKIDGRALSAYEQTAENFPPLKVKHYLGLWATLAEASLATIDLDEELATRWLKEFWSLKLRTDKYRYYDNLLYFFALLALSGNYQKAW